MKVVKKAPTKAQAEKTLSEMEGCRFASFLSMEEWIRYHMENDLPDLTIQECPLNEEIAEGNADVDYTADGSFGKNMLGCTYPDFTIEYLIDNAKQMYVTWAHFN